MGAVWAGIPVPHGSYYLISYTHFLSLFLNSCEDVLGDYLGYMSQMSRGAISVCRAQKTEAGTGPQTQEADQSQARKGYDRGPDAGPLQVTEPCVCVCVWGQPRSSRVSPTQ